MGWGFLAGATLIAGLAILYWRLGPIRRWLGRVAKRSGLSAKQTRGTFFILTLALWLVIWLTLREDYGGALDAVMDEVFGSGGELDTLMDDVSGRSGEVGTEQ